MKLLPAQLFPSALVNELGFALPQVVPDRYFMASSQLTNCLPFTLYIPPPAHPKSRLPTPPGVTRKA